MHWYLTAYDYGMGAVYTFVEAESSDAITARYPELTVLAGPPPWMDSAEVAQLRAQGERLRDPGVFLTALDRMRLDGPRAS